MMRARIAAIAVPILLVGWASAQIGAAGRLYFLRDDVDKQWCGYASESRYKARAESLRARVVGGVDYVDGHIRTVRVTEEDETGDWVVYDEYVLDKSGRILSLKRTINILPENNSEEQVFLVKDGRAVKQSSVRRELRTGKPTQDAVDWFEAPPVVTSLQAFPFRALIAGNGQAVRLEGQGCVPVAPK